MLQLLISSYNQTVDYTKYLDETTVSIQEQLNIPTTMTFTLQPSDARFLTPARMAYVSLWSTVTQRSVCSGFINATPVRTYMALSGRTPADTGGQLFTYSVSVTSDEYLLNCKAVPFIPAFVNRYQGDILTTIANILCPGYFDTSNVAQGDLVPYYVYSPTQTWCEIAKAFGDPSRYRYKARDKKLWYQPYGDQDFGIKYAEGIQSAFDPKALNTSVLAAPLVNDLTIIGQTEAGNNREDYFLGDGFTGNFPLLHQVFRGYSTNLVQESWNEGQLNTQQWFVLDPGDNFSYNAGALNVVDTLASPFESGESYLSMNNGLEIAGGTDIQVGEAIFSDYSDGVLGGLYLDTDFTDDKFIAGFSVTTPFGVVTSASGAAGVYLQPSLSGQLLGAPVVTEINHSYVLQMLITAPVYTRFTQVYRTLAGVQYGGDSNSTSGNITFNIQDYDIGAATGIFYNPNVTSYQVDNVALPPFAVLALVNNHKLTVSIVNSTVATMPLGGLHAFTGPSGLMQPTGLILPMLPPDSGGFIGTASDISGAGSGNVLIYAGVPLVPGLLQEPAQVLVLGNGYDLQAAQVTQGQSADTLAFYTQSLPAAGTRIRFQSWQSQAAISRLQISGDIADQSALVGDDGIRSAIVSNLSPLPRTSEDCMNAAQAFLSDRAGTTYNGTYMAQNVPGASFFRGVDSDEQYWPTVGRFMAVNAPRRGINAELFFVTQLTTTILDSKSELLQWQITFGSDLILEKVLYNFVDIVPQNVLTPTDTAVPPVPFLTQNVTNSFLPDLSLTRLDATKDMNENVVVQVLDAWAGAIEVRNLDTNWGRSQIASVSSSALEAAADGATPLLVYQWNTYYQQLTGIVAPPPQVVFPHDPTTTTYTAAAYLTGLETLGLNTGLNTDRTLIGVFYGPQFTLPRLQFDQVWFLRPVTQPNNAFGVITSLRSKVLRIMWPMKPSVPLFVAQTATVLQFNFNGDIRNIYGFELRATIIAPTPGYPFSVGQQIVLVQKPVASYADMTIDLLQTDFLSLSQSLLGIWTFQAYFWNQGWVYSDPLTVNAVPTVAGGGYYEITPYFDPLTLLVTVNIDLNNGLTQQITLSNGVVFTVNPPYDSNSQIQLRDGDVFTLFVDQPQGGGALPPVFSVAVGGFDPNTGNWQLDGTAFTRTTYVFVRSQGTWGLQTAPPVTGAAITTPVIPSVLFITVTEIDPSAAQEQPDGSYAGVDIFTASDVSAITQFSSVVVTGNSKAVLNATYNITAVFTTGTSVIEATVAGANIPAGTTFGTGGVAEISGGPGVG